MREPSRRRRVDRHGRAVGISVVAEGVETPEQARLLEQMQCGAVQGFLYARPMFAPEATAWLVEHANGNGATADQLFA